MAYYNKEEVLAYAETENEKVKKKKLKSLTPIEQTVSQLDNEEEIVGFFWVNITDGEKLKMNGKTFIRIDHDLYTDDRFAVDLYQAQEESKSVSEIIKKRIVEQKTAKKEIKNKKDIEQKIKETIKKKKKK